MNGIIKLFEVLIRVILPQKLNDIFFNRIKRIKDILLSTYELRIFFKVIVFPLKLIADLIVAIFKILLVILLPQYIYGNLKYSVKLFYGDAVSRKLKLIVILKRFYLFWKLIIDGREKRKSFGNLNPDKIFFVIRPYYYMETNELTTTISNLMFHYYRNLQHLSYAIKNNWIPVVDWENYGPFSHAEKYPINGTKNCWEYFWKQPSDYTLKEVYASENVILSSRNSVDYGLIPSTEIKSPFNKYIKDLMIKCVEYDNYNSLNEFTYKFVDTWKNILFGDNKKILGCSVRGMSYGIKNVPGHPIQPKIKELIKMVEKRLIEWNMEYVFFACESEVLVEEMKEHFKEKLILLPRDRYKKIPEKEDDPLYEDGHRYKTNLEYLTEMYLLSKCNSLIAGMSGGVRVAVIWNKNMYEHVEIFENKKW
jgi:hypothetical protein